MNSGPPGKAEVEAVLNGIIDPCSEVAGNPAGLVDMGLVKDLRIEPAAEGSIAVHVSLRVTEPGCLMGGVFLNEARRRLGALSGVTLVEVNLSHDFNWHPEEMSGAPAERMRTLRRALEHTVPLAALRHLERRTRD
ncbi:MAG: iron-sulfur cluster assembly protein [Gammaproteobacteria bacterium]